MFGEAEQSTGGVGGQREGSSTERLCVCCVGNSLCLWDLVKRQENPEGEAAVLLLRCSSPWSPWEQKC